MQIKQDISQIKPLLDSAKEVVILFGPQATPDSVAGALGLYLSFNSAQKRVTIASPKKITVELTNLIGINKVTNSLGNKNFVISLDYSEDSIEKVSYHVEAHKFNLVIEPRAGAPMLSSDKVSYGYSGFSADCIIVVGTSALEELGGFYEQNKAVFADKPIINIDNRLTNRRFGQVNLIGNSASVSELVYQVVQGSQLPVNPDVATNLYFGVAQASNNFSSPQTTADTFEVVAQLLRAGARKGWGKRQEGKQIDVSALYKQQEEKPYIETQVSGIEQKGSTPPDWLKPKIYKGSGLL